MVIILQEVFKKDGGKIGKVKVTFRNDDEDYGVILTCFENRLPEYSQNEVTWVSGNLLKEIYYLCLPVSSRGVPASGV